jgi:hypothetical protein
MGKRRIFLDKNRQGKENTPKETIITKDKSNHVMKID